MRISDVANLIEIDGQTRFVDHPALLLDSSLAGKVEDITFAKASQWVVDQIAAVDHHDVASLNAKIDETNDRLEDIKACALWPVSAHAHMQLVHQLRGILGRDRDEDTVDMPFSDAADWANNEVMKVNLKDPFAIAERIAAAASRLESPENCRRWPGSAYAHRKVVTELTVFLRRTRGSLH